MEKEKDKFYRLRFSNYKTARFFLRILKTLWSRGIIFDGMEGRTDWKLRAVDNYYLIRLRK